MDGSDFFLPFYKKKSDGKGKGLKDQLGDKDEQLFNRTCNTPLAPLMQINIASS